MAAMAHGVFAPLQRLAAAERAAPLSELGAACSAGPIAAFARAHPLAGLLFASAQFATTPGAAQGAWVLLRFAIGGPFKDHPALPTPVWLLVCAVLPDALTVHSLWRLFGKGSPLSALGLTLAAAGRVLRFWAQTRRPAPGGGQLAAFGRSLLTNGAIMMFCKAMQRQKAFRQLRGAATQLLLVSAAGLGFLAIPLTTHWAVSAVLRVRAHLGDAGARRQLRRLARPRRQQWIYQPPAPEDAFGPGDEVVVRSSGLSAEVACRVEAADGSRPGVYYAVRFPQLATMQGRLRVYPVERLAPLPLTQPDFRIDDAALTRTHSGRLRTVSGEAIELFGNAPGDDDCCLLCFDEAQEVLFEPCRHLCACCGCARRLSQCPMCREEITARLKVPKQAILITAEEPAADDSAAAEEPEAPEDQEDQDPDAQSCGLS
eukprot:TRINITY_DN1326_c1_g1_i1.p1 TRINITY_DN1326_c1_g1~~TRINITY_DN1326_c1_g1_i1.p1  ORF type:complete len:452 (+),score=122.00 TRINITY_DN1326_c1_g1_i1:68-1357(+)